MVFPICIPAELYVEHPKTLFDLDFSKQLALDHYKLVCFWIDLLFDAQQGSRPGVVFAKTGALRKEYQCVLMVEMLRKTSIGCNSEPFQVYFPEKLDSCSHLNAIVRTSGIKWQKEKQITGDQLCQEFAEHLMHCGEPIHPQVSNDDCAKYIKERLNDPLGAVNFYCMSDETCKERIAHMIHDTKAEHTNTGINVDDLFSESNFAGFRFLFIMRDRILDNFNGVLWKAFARNMELILRKMMQEKSFHAQIPQEVKKYIKMSQKSRRRADCVRFQREDLPLLCETLIETYERKYHGGIKEVLNLLDEDEQHIAVFTHEKLATLINNLLPWTQKIPVDMCGTCEELDTEEIINFHIGGLVNVGCAFSNRNYLDITHKVTKQTFHVTHRDMERNRESICEEYTVQKKQGRTISVDPMQTCWENYYVDGFLCPPLMRNDSYMLFNPKHSIKVISKASLTWEKRSQFTTAVQSIEDIFQQTEPNLKNPCTFMPIPKHRKISENRDLFVDGSSFFFSQARYTVDEFPDAYDNEGVVEKIERALSEPFKQLRSALSMSSDLCASRDLKHVLIQTYEEDALSLWKSFFRKYQEKLSQPNVFLMQWRKKNTLCVKDEAMCPRLTAVGNHIVHLAHQCRKLFGLYNQFALAREFITMTYDSLTLTHHDQKLYGSKQKRCVIVYGKHGCGKSFTAKVGHKLVIEGTVKDRDAETAQSFYQWLGADSTRETKFFDEPPSKFLLAGKVRTSEKTADKTSSMLRCITDQFVSKESVCKKRNKLVGTSIDIHTKINFFINSNKMTTCDALEDRFILIHPPTHFGVLENKLKAINRCSMTHNLEEKINSFVHAQQVLQWRVSMAVQMICTGVIPCGVNVRLSEIYLQQLIHCVEAVMPGLAFNNRKITLLKRKLWLRVIHDAVIMAHSPPFFDILTKHIFCDGQDFCDLKFMQKALPYFLFAMEESIVHELCDSVDVYMCPSHTEVLSFTAQNLCHFRYPHPYGQSLRILFSEIIKKDKESTENLFNRHMKNCSGMTRLPLDASLRNMTQELPKPLRKDDIKDKLEPLLEGLSLFHSKYTERDPPGTLCDPAMEPNKHYYTGFKKQRNDTFSEDKDTSTYKRFEYDGNWWSDTNYLEIRRSESQLNNWFMSHFAEQQRGKKEYYSRDVLSRIFKELKRIKVRFKPTPPVADEEWLRKKLKNRKTFLKGLKFPPKDFWGPRDHQGRTVGDAFQVTQQIGSDGKSKPIIYISVHYLTQCEPKDILGTWLEHLRTPYTRKRKIPLGFTCFPVEGMPELCKLYEMTPIDVYEERSCKTPGLEHVKSIKNATEDLEIKFAKEHHRTWALNEDICRQVHEGIFGSTKDRESERKYPRRYILDEVVSVFLGDEQSVV